MRLSTLLQFAAAAATVAVPAVAGAAPLRAASALPARNAATSAVPVRAATPTDRESKLIGFPILAFVGLFGAVALVTVVAAGSSRSPG